MEIFGWICMVLILGHVTLIYGIVALNGLGKYNIGGVPNKWYAKIIIVGLGFCVGFLWKELFSVAPFTVTIS